MREAQRWNAAHREQDIVIGAFTAASCARFASLADRVAAIAAWHRPRAPGKWSLAALVLHVCRAYELGFTAVTALPPGAGGGGGGMRLRVSPLQAWLGRTLVLPLVFATQRFPQGARAPAEVVPDAIEAAQLTPETAHARLLAAATRTAAALRQTARERPTVRITHAYFGALTPYQTLRLLSAHTRHHTRGLTSRSNPPPSSVAVPPRSPPAG